MQTPVEQKETELERKQEPLPCNPEGDEEQDWMDGLIMTARELLYFCNRLIIFVWK